MKIPPDPESLRDRETVEFETETRTLSRAEFETARGLENHVAVGVTNESGEVLLVNDGSRGWTVPSVAVAPNEDWDSVGRRMAASLTGVDAELDRPVRVRRVDFQREDDSERRRTTYNIVVRTEPVTGRPIADDPTVGRDEQPPGPEEDVETKSPAVGEQELLWLDRVPEGQSGEIAADIRSLLD
ncbi:hypothetical protein GS429_16730 [Natronorubrum sp. JWXQ-INN-674]|uniref:Nudix hydrolase domain-containing protein n=1 Tax=Natronorubrum halalkaliphilum TaxID=2691917 RepID=A0A6B0VQC6_9EURY|nr:hypothetical protein [Natronorubrum halalkaliphilum]MXV63674.1 hypothetical protein [Natronorubrum halalkaliphilum]